MDKQQRKTFREQAKIERIKSRSRRRQLRLKRRERRASEGNIFFHKVLPSALELIITILK